MAIDLSNVGKIKPADEAWAASWAKEIADIRGDVSYEESSKRLRKLIETGLLRFTDIRDNPERFFLAHRLLSKKSPHLGPGFFIRFTVQYNLFAGSVVALGGPEQLAALEEIQSKGQLGCFGLTEKLAGVQSGAVAMTKATWDEAEQVFVLQSGEDAADKNWISQGCTADKCVVVADLLVAGRSHGPHAFLMDFRRNGQLVNGVVIGDMGRKTVGNDLDNAWIKFENVRLPKDNLLNRYADVIDGKYVQKQEGIRTMEMIGQRLFSGRVAVAQAALMFGKELYAMTKSYSDSKACYAPGGDLKLSDIAHIKALYARADPQFALMDRFLEVCEVRLNECLRAGTIPPLELQEAIAVAKVRGVETSIALCFALKQEVGSYALMEGAGFEQSDFLQCCKFAEGDSRILMQKMARDRMRTAQKEGGAGDASGEEARLCKELGDAMAKGGKTAWDDNFDKVFNLADVLMDRTMQKWVPSSSL